MIYVFKYKNDLKNIGILKMDNNLEDNTIPLTVENVKTVPRGKEWFNRSLSLLKLEIPKCCRYSDEHEEIYNELFHERPVDTLSKKLSNKEIVLQRPTSAASTIVLTPASDSDLKLIISKRVTSSNNLTPTEQEYSDSFCSYSPEKNIRNTPDLLSSDDDLPRTLYVKVLR
jgi:hypothetical protein